MMDPNNPDPRMDPAKKLVVPEINAHVLLPHAQTVPSARSAR